MTSKVVMFFFVVLLVACSSKTEKPYNSKLSIRDEIFSKTNIKLDTTKFIVLEDSVKNTEEAFDSDYTWFVKIKFDNNYFETTKKKIRLSTKYNFVTSEVDENWKKMDTSKIKGIWYLDSSSYKYIENPKNYKSESVQISIDTLTKRLEFTLIHL